MDDGLIEIDNEGQFTRREQTLLGFLVLIVSLFVANQKLVCIMGYLDGSSIGTCATCVFNTSRDVSLTPDASQSASHSPSHVLATFRTHAVELDRMLAWLDEVKQWYRVCDHITLPNKPFLDDPLEGTIVTRDKDLVYQSYLVRISFTCLDLSNIGIGEQGIPDTDIVSNTLIYFLDGDGIVKTLG